MKISVVSPVYRAENILDTLVERIENSVSKLTSDYEIILVEDGGPDDSWGKIEKLTQSNSRITGIQLSRNFGQHCAITAGLDQASGDWIVVMDCDLQDQPEEISKLLAKAEEGYDVVLASRYNRIDGYFKKLFSKLFYRTLSYLTGSEHDETIANFGIYHKKVINAVVAMREPIRFFPSMVKWVGFKTTRVEVEHAAREEGESNYNFGRLIQLAINIVLAFSDKPLQILIKVGAMISFGSILIAFIYIYKWLMGDIEVLGFTSLIVSIWFLSGLIMATLGVVGIYVGKTFEGVKNRPIYVVKTKINGE